MCAIPSQRPSPHLSTYQIHAHFLVHDTSHLLQGIFSNRYPQPPLHGALNIIRVSFHSVPVTALLFLI